MIKALTDNGFMVDLDARDAVLASGRYSSEQTSPPHRGSRSRIRPRDFADVLGALDQISDAAFASYGVETAAVQGLRRRFAEWHKELRQV